MRLRYILLDPKLTADSPSDPTPVDRKSLSGQPDIPLEISRCANEPGCFPSFFIHSR